MNSLRPLAASLILLSGILHVFLYFKGPGDPGSTAMLVVGLIYVITGLLIFTGKKYALYLGIAIPLIGMTLSFVKFGMPEILSFSALFKLLGTVAVICCGIVLFRKRK
ncbi:MAG TPA: hypothetical protein DCX89_00510 [Saprospirales bacterium]|nr:hypothetical protein [Saprospirales bacterium]HAY70348.1 hypothetical protein [Saprospirales bacterium]HRQ29337.1 hypothetical protein [Saprospiraceae bacterium]